MLKIIKSKQIFKFIFSYVIEKRKLEIIKHNKNLQNLNGINLYNYKLFNEDYYIFEENGKIKEYKYFKNEPKNEKLIIFEGEYLNGKRLGKGKEYDQDGNLLFEGE